MIFPFIGLFKVYIPLDLFDGEGWASLVLEVALLLAPDEMMS